MKESGSAAHQSDYYPFGLEMSLRVTTTDATRERYTGHEIEALGSITTWYYAGHADSRYHRSRGTRTAQTVSARMSKLRCGVF